MAKDSVTVISQASWIGGISYNSKTSIPFAARFMQNLDIFRDKDSVTHQPGAVKDSGSTVVDLPLWGASGQPWDTNVYFYGNAGKIYKRTSGGTYSVDRTVGTTDGYGQTIAPAGQGMAVFLDGLYYATDKTLGRKYLLDGTPAYNDDFISGSGTTFSNDADVSLNSTYTGPNTYTTATSITRTAANRVSFTPGYDPLKVVQLYVVAKGTGNWTVQIEDTANNVIGSSTVTNANLTGGAYNNFFFSTPLRVSIGQTYYAYVTSTVADGTVACATSSNFSTANFKTAFGVLIASAPYHPMIPFGYVLGGAGVVIGNGPYLAAYYLTNSGMVYDPTLITLDPGYFVRSLVIDQGYLVAFADRGTDTNSYQEGRLYYWDGSNSNYNFSIPVVTGVPNASQSFKGRTFMVAGNQGDLYLSPVNSSETRRIQRLPQLGNGQTIEVAPGATDVWQNIMRLGYGINGTDANFHAGVWDFGTQTDRGIDWQQAAVEVLNYSTTISTGNTDPNKVSIGCIFALGQQMFIGWKDTTSGTVYGVDIVTKNANPATNGSFESLIEDRGIDPTTGEMMHMPQKNKHGISLLVTFLPLPSGCSVTPKYKINRGSWTLGPTDSTLNDTFTILPITTGGDYKEIEFGFNSVASGANAPTITSVQLIADLLVSEGPDTPE